MLILLTEFYKLIIKNKSNLTIPDFFAIISYSYLPVDVRIFDDSPIARGAISYLVNDLGYFIID